MKATLLKLLGYCKSFHVTSMIVEDKALVKEQKND